jgi:hypothetical protein
MVRWPLLVVGVSDPALLADAGVSGELGLPSWCRSRTDWGLETWWNLGKWGFSGEECALSSCVNFWIQAWRSS